MGIEFIAEVFSVSPQVVLWNGQRMEYFLTWESADLSLAAGDRVRCLLVKATQQLFVVDKIV